MRIYHAFKISLDGTLRRWDHVANLTHDEARDPVRFPLGRHVEDGCPYIWSYAIMPDHVPGKQQK